MVDDRSAPGRLYHASPALRALVEQLWPLDSGVLVSVGSRPSGNHDVLERYAVVPSPRRARFLLPQTTRAAAAAGATCYNALRPQRLRITRRLAGTVARVAPGGLPQLVVAAPDGDGAAISTQRVRAILGADVGFAIGVRPDSPNHKPTLQAFHRDGSPAGFAKVSWNPSTATQVRVEADALATVAGQLRRLRAPALLGHDGAGTRLFTVASPLPLSVRRWSNDDRHPPLDLTRDVLEVAGSSRWTLAESAQVARLRALCGGTELPAPLAAVMTSGLDRLLAGFGTARWLFGAWHGDWVPWNIAVTDDGVYAWDWEHFGLDAAAGLDVLHWHFQVSFIGRQRPLAESFRRAATSAAAAVAELQRDASVAPAAAMLYALEMTARQYRMYAGGGGWDPRYYPDAIGVLADVQREWLGA